MILENIEIDINIDKAFLKNIGIDIDIDKEILENINIDKILNRLEFGISNRARWRGERTREKQLIVQKHSTQAVTKENIPKKEDGSHLKSNRVNFFFVGPFLKQGRAGRA